MDTTGLTDGLLSEKSNIKVKTKKILSTEGKILIGVTGGIGLGLSIICIPFVTPALRKVCLPYVPATDVQVGNVVRALQGRSGKLLDIGSGDGRIVIAAAKHGFSAHGVELNPWLVQFSRINSYLNKVNQNTAFYRKDLWKFGLSPYNNVVIFGVEEMMTQLEKKIEAEVQHGTTIVACRFPLTTMKPKEVIGTGVDTVWKYQFEKS